MKRSAIIMTVLLLLSAGGLGFAHHRVSKSGEQLSFQEYPLAGELSQAEGLRIAYHADLDRRLFWEAELTPGKPNPAKMRFFAKRQREENSQEGYFQLYAPISMSTSTTGSFELQEDGRWLKEAFLELAEETADGTTGEKTVQISDYEHFYPLELDFRSRYQHYMGASELQEEDAFLKGFQKAFRFPVLEGQRETLSLRKDAAGMIRELSMSPTERGPEIYSISFSSEDTLYFIPEARQENGSLLDYSLTPGGYGVYSLPLNKESLSMEDLHFVCPLDPERQLQSSAYDPETRSLLACYEAGETWFFSSIDLQSGKETQKLALGKGEVLGMQLQEELLLIFRKNLQADFLQKGKNGSFERRFVLAFPDEMSFWNVAYTDCSCLYDGDRLALVTPLRDVTGKGELKLGYFNSSYGLYVFSPEGSPYIAYFLSDLDRGSQGQNSKASCRLSEDRQLILEEGGKRHG